MNEFYFENIQDLYNRLKPALRSKARELKLKYKIIIKEEEIFKYLSESKWNTSKDLTIYDMVEDILYHDNDKILDYVAKTK